MRRGHSNVVPFRRRRRWTRARDYGVRRDARFGGLVAATCLAAFTAVFLWHGPPIAWAVPPPAGQAGAAPPSGAELRAHAWPTSPEALDAAQPRVGGTMRGSAAPDRIGTRFTRCNGPVRDNCVIDGDTFWYRGEKVRVADINAPETHDPQCAYEAQLGARATDRLQALLNAGPFTLQPIDRDRDVYGRLLRTVTRRGESVGGVLVSEGLAEEWRGYRRDWC